MGKDIIDKKIKDQLFDHESFIDNDQLWAAIDQKRNQRRPVLYWVFTGFVLLVGLTGFVLLSSPNEANQPTLQSSIVQIETSAIDEATEADMTVQVEAAHSETAENNMEIKNETYEKKAAPQENSISKSNLELSSTRKEQTNSSVSKSNKIKSETTSNTASQQISIIAESKHSPSINLVETEIQLKEKLSSPIEVNNQETFKLASISLSEPDALSYLRNIETPETPSIRYFRNRQIECYNHSQKKSNISLLAYTGPEFILRNLSTESTEAATIEYLEARKNTEIVLEGVRSGLQLRYLNETGLFFQAGIEYQRLNERLTHTVMQDSTYELLDQIIEIKYNADGTIDTCRGPVTVTEIQSRTSINYNKYHFFNIPLQVGYQKEFGKWSYSAQVGATMNLGFSFSGSILEENMSPTDDPDYFKDNIGLSLTAGIGVGYRIAPDFKVWALPSFKMDLNTINRATYPIDQKYRTVGLLAGLELLF